jgi:hypothetical protein
MCSAKYLKKIPSGDKMREGSQPMLSNGPERIIEHLVPGRAERRAGLETPPFDFFKYQKRKFA